VCELGLSV